MRGQNPRTRLKTGFHLSTTRETYREILDRLDVASKEAEETLAFLDVVEPYLRSAFDGCGPEHIVDVGGGRGLTAFCWLCLSDVSRATIVDQYMPVSYMATLRALRRRLSFASPAFSVGKLGEFETVADLRTAFVGIHCCGSLTDDVIDAAIQAQAPFAVMTCCHPHTDPLLKPATGWLRPGQDPSCLIDLMRLDRARERGYAVSLEQIDECITPKNLILLGKPRGPHKKVRPERVPNRSSLSWAELTTLRSRKHHLGRILHGAERGALTCSELLPGARHTNLRLEDDGGEDYLVRLCSGATDRASAVEGLEREQRFYEIARDLDVPVPKVLTVDGRGKLIRDPFMLRQYVPGEPLSLVLDRVGAGASSDQHREMPPLGPPVDGGKMNRAGRTPKDLPPSTGGPRGGTGCGLRAASGPKLPG